MMTYFKLVDFEVKRFWKIYAVLIALLVILQPIAMLFSVSGVEETIKNRGYSFGDDMPITDLVMPITEFTWSFLFLLPNLLCIGALIFYVFGTWYLEWFGKNTFAYQMLLLPVNRMAVYFAKLTSLLLFIIGCLVVQLAIFPLLKVIYTSGVPLQYQENVNLISWLSSHDLLNTVIPTNSIDFIASYSLGIMVVIIIFTMIILERSFRLKGIGLAIVYGLVCLLLFGLADIIIEPFLFLYNMEYLIIKVICMAIIIVLSIWISHYALNKKISV